MTESESVHESDASDIRLIMVALWGKRLCITCLSAQTGVPTPRIEATITTLAAVLAIRKSVAGCERCSESIDVFGLI